jgi:uncharacterized protein (DUF58 family)
LNDRRAALVQPWDGRWNRTREEAEHLAAQLPPLLIAAEALTSAVALGVHGRRKAGMGESFWQFRRYRNEDSATAIDWRQSAKSQHLFVREREWEAAETVWFFRDRSPGMDYTSSRDVPAKRERANVLALALASLLVRGGERVGLLGGDHAAATGRVALSRFAHGLEESGGDNPFPPDPAQGRRSALVWLSDFFAPLESIEARMRALAGRGMQGYLVQIMDPAEEEFPFTGRVQFELPVRGEHALFGRAQNVRDAYRQRLQAHVESLGQTARRLGWSFTRHRTDHSPATALIALYSALGGMRAGRGF